MQLLALSLESYITPITVKAALFLVTFIFVCIGLGRRSRCGLIAISATALIAAGLCVVQMMDPRYVFIWETPALLAVYVVISFFALLTVWFRWSGIVTGTTLFAVEIYQVVMSGAPLLFAAMKGFHDASGALSEQEMNLWGLAWCLFSMLFMVIYCMVIGFNRSFFKKDRALIESEELLQTSPLPMEMTLEEIMPNEEILPEEEIIPVGEIIPVTDDQDDVGELLTEEESTGGIGAEILRYKHLLDEGLITAEVFREKKAELMNGMTWGKS